MSSLDAAHWIAVESDAFASALDPELLDRHVPGCPEWTLRELAWHLGRVQRFWAAVIRTGADVEPTFSSITGPNDAAELHQWMRASTAELLDALRDVPAETPAWTWWRDDRTVRAIGRHQVQEAAVHRWDAQSVGGAPAPLPAPVASDGLEEFLAIARQLRDAAPIVFETTDSGARVAAGDGPPTATVSGSASNLVLLLHGRVDIDCVDVEGDPSVLTPFLIPIG